MDEFPGNSHKARETIPEPATDRNPEEKRVEKVVVGKVIRRKKPLGRRFTETFVGGDARSVWDYVTKDVLVPALKDTFADMIQQGIERMLFGEGRSINRRGGARPPGSGNYTPYNRYSSASYSRHDREDSRPMSRRARASHDLDEIILATRVEAEEVVDRLFDLVQRYEQATLADLYELVDITANYTDDKYGWRDLRGAGVVRVRNGWLLDLPRPEPLDTR